MICRRQHLLKTYVLFSCLKKKSTEKIDGAVAMIMASDRAIRNGNVISESVYDERGILLL